MCGASVSRPEPLVSFLTLPDVSPQWLQDTLPDVLLLYSFDLCAHAVALH